MIAMYRQGATTYGAGRADAPFLLQWGITRPLPPHFPMAFLSIVLVNKYLRFAVFNWLQNSQFILS